MTKPEFTLDDAEQAGRNGKVFIYFVQAGGFIKIGKTINWTGRIPTMQTGSPYTIVPLLIVVDDPSLEKKLHVRFRQSHFRGEWFHSGEAITRYIKENLHRCVAHSGIGRIPTKAEASEEWIAL